MLSHKDFISQVYEREQELIAYRRKVHAFAETGGKEEKTSAFIKEKLNEFGIQTVPVEGKSVLGILETGKKGPHIGFRADIDALPMPEDACNLKQKKVVISDTPESSCHACGHDAHTAMLLTAAHIFSENRDELTGTLYFVFESGEENGSGFKPVMDALSPYAIDTFWAIHVLNYIPAGQICVSAGPRMAGAAIVDIEFIGRGGHGSRPDLSVNPVFCAANFLVNTSTAFVNQINANETVTLGITSIQGGEAANIIPEKARVIGSMRFYNHDEGVKAVNIVREVASHTAAYSGCRAEFATSMQRVGTPLINDDYYAGLIGKRLKEVLPAGSVVDAERWYASESFGGYLRKYPGVMAHLGIKNETLGSGAEHHNPKFDIDESALKVGVIATVEYALAVMENGIKV